MAAYFALAAAAGLIGVWGLTWADILPDEFVPRQLAASHVAAEMLAAFLLASGGIMTLTSERAHWLLAAGLGALAYASLNVMSDFGDEPIMLAILAATVGLAIAALVLAFRDTEAPGEKGGRA